MKKKELIKPVQDRVFEAVEIVAKNNRLQIVFDKSGELVMIYTDPIHDYTDYVLEELKLEENNLTLCLIQFSNQLCKTSGFSEITTIYSLCHKLT